MMEKCCDFSIYFLMNIGIMLIVLAVFGASIYLFILGFNRVNVVPDTLGILEIVFSVILIILIISFSIYVVLRYKKHLDQEHNRIQDANRPRSFLSRLIPW